MCFHDCDDVWLIEKEGKNLCSPETSLCCPVTELESDRQIPQSRNTAPTVCQSAHFWMPQPLKSAKMIIMQCKKRLIISGKISTDNYKRSQTITHRELDCESTDENMWMASWPMRSATFHLYFTDLGAEASHWVLYKQSAMCGSNW